MNMNAPTIKTVIDPEDRLNFGPEWLTLPGVMAFEHCLYNLARDMVEGYNGGLWDFYRLSNGIRFIQFGEDNARFHLTSPNYADHEVTAEATAITLNLCALSHACFYTEGKAQGQLSNAFHELREWAMGHAEAEANFNLID